ncbi:hypothetical protein M3Y99_00036400 [Aphelenchoides fujianensis]|nr:hypothetical protein M3Y99_00036400 [Aphelenchoides fujianensis]
MIRRPLTSIGLKQADVDQMEGCLLRRSKNPEQNENEASPHVQRSGSEAPSHADGDEGFGRARAGVRVAPLDRHVGGQRRDVGRPAGGRPLVAGQHFRNGRRFALNFPHSRSLHCK